MKIRIWDFETGGLTTPEGDVLECGWTDIALPARTIYDPKSYLCGTSRPITPANRAVHHINPATLIGRAPFDAEAFNAAAIEDGVTCLAAFNAQFDCQWLPTTLPVICVYRCALRIWPEFESHGNSAVFYALEDAGKARNANYAHITTHRAGPDSYVTAFNLKAMLDEGFTGKQLLAWSKEPPLFPRIPLGKFKGQPWSAADIGWLQWAVFKSDLSSDLKHNAQLELNRR